MRRIRIAIAFFVLATFVYVSALTSCNAASFVTGLEKQIGYSGYQQTLRQKRVVRLPHAQSLRLNRIFEKLIRTGRRHEELNYTLTVVADEAINAFALPGGYIFINTGLLNFAENDGEVAGVLAHEIAHVECKHGINTVSRAIGFTLLLDLLANRSPDPEKSAQLGAIAITLLQRGYSREAEYEADAYGVRFTTAAGYSKQDMIAFFKKLQQKYGSQNNYQVLQLLNTHPPTDERIKRIEKM
jgi:predicted Zn-dependent protease